MYSTAKDIHVAITSKLYQTNSNRKRTLRPEEIDEGFNRAMLAFIEERSIVSNVVNGLDETVKRQDDLRDLEVTRKAVNILTNITATPSYYLDKRIYAVLPNDYNKFESLELAISYDCHREENDVELITNPNTILSLPFDVNTIEDLNIVITTPDGNYSAEDNNLDTLSNIASKFMVINSVLNTAEFEVYWETYLSYHLPNHFIIVTSAASTVVTLQANGNTVTGTRIDDDLQSFKDVDNEGKLIVTNTVNTELVASKDLADIKSNLYAYRNRWKKPLIELERNTLVIDYNPAYVPLKGFMTYRKNPIFINLKADIMTDFKSHIAEIIDMAVAMLQLTFEGKDGLIATTTKNIQ